MNATIRCLVCTVFFGLSALIAAAQKTNPKPVSMASPGYPAALEDSGKNGEAKVSFVVTAEGRVAEPELVSADDPAFGAAALAVIGEWTFEPATVDGKAVDLRVTIPFRFKAPPEQVFNARVGRKVFVTPTEGVPVLSTEEYGSTPKPVERGKAPSPQGLSGKTYDESVTVNFLIDPSGHVVNPEFSTPPKLPELAGPALLAVARTTYPAMTKDGKPVYVRASETLKFSGDGK